VIPINTRPVIRITITQEAFEAIAAAMPLGTVSYEADHTGKAEVHIWLEPHVLNKLRILRGPGEEYSDVIVKLAAEGARS
jgi:hypothetical protein